MKSLNKTARAIFHELIEPLRDLFKDEVRKAFHVELQEEAVIL